MRFLFRPPADEAAGLLALPWDQPLEEWPDDVVLHVPQRGISRHVVRFVANDGAVYALKEIVEPLARKEYALLGAFAAEGLPAVSVLGICVDRPGDQPAILVTRYLEYSVSYRHLFATSRGEHSTEQLIDTMVELLVRLHLAGVFWGDCSLSNTLFRPDAGTMAAYLVDAETVERHPSLSTGQRLHDLDLAADRVGAELLDLEFGGLLPRDVDPIETAAGFRAKYEALWDELTREEFVAPAEQRSRVAERLRRLDDLGFDAGEIELVTSPEGARLRVRTRVAEPGHHRRELFRLTGLEVQENQARRLLDDLRSYRARLEQRDGVPVPETVAGHRWVAEVYAPVVESIPAELVGRLAPAEMFHEILEHRWFLSEVAGADVGTTEAARSYVETVLPQNSPEVTSPSAVLGLL
ncbi:DUF4032 domain-containing protein [Geodermatophilus sp. YIM 151500]|uniref:DUF4032 domain-containing protein n=1 Tax=Geodermatophilus sp. YIM 151500 TaxID=2984531 RepID=UPI0021E3D578|nr:DUF4032 domain-containing protein [Geodermatophilus sp. YIM 151500]MCV2491104.1 DUF4032 domain-containing protein [Geodermatophilus sp. YIM 151500]